MDFSIPDKTQKLLEQVRAFVDSELLPLESNLLSTPFRLLLPALQQKRSLVKQLGLWCPQVPTVHGGLGLGFLEFALIGEQLGRSPLGHFAFNCQAPDAGNIEILIEKGTDEQKERWLKPLLAGQIRSCFSMTERDRSGSNPVWMDTTAVQDGNEYVINGHKWFTTAADGASFAIVMAVTNPDAEPHARASQIIVPTDTAGFELVRNIPCFGHAGDDWLSHAEIRYNDCRVPIQNRLGDEGSGFAIAQARLGPGRIHHCMRWIGVAQRCFEIMCDRATERMVAPDQALASKQTVTNWIADSRAEIDAARLMTLHAAWKIDQLGAKQARLEISSIKFFVSEMLQRVIDRAIQTCGAYGISDDTVLPFFFANERGGRIYDGPNEVHRNVVARQALKPYFEKRDHG